MRTMLLVVSCSLACVSTPTTSPASTPRATVSAPAAAPSTLGTIKEVRRSGAVLVIAHEDIPGVMPAMTMPFQVEEKARRSDLQKGDRVRFWISERDGLYVIIQLERA